VKSLSLEQKKKGMRTGNVVSKELLSHLVMLEAEHQGKVLSYIKRLLGEAKILDEGLEMNQRAEASEQDIAGGRVKKAETFKRDFEQWQKKKRAGMKL
jgi:hypothetical protein